MKAATPVLPNGARGRGALNEASTCIGPWIGRKGLAFEGFEPCEAKVSRTVLWGSWAG